ncbi:MAG: HDOD domain-containing protein [Sedimentisphaerales bacterium]|nr:HDOD domain-containing protein [Sedimentisphaerales bacterium]
MSVKRKILFVDDEQNVLDGLRRMLRSMRHEWEMIFTTRGREALEILDRESIDIIISDMRMPDMDGIELSNEVKNRHPQVVRLALSGQTSKKAILESVGPIHQYISKPCDAQTLKDTINRVCSLRELLTNQTLQGVITQLGSLPCVPQIYHELMTELNSGNTSIDKVAQIISRDVGMSVKIMQLVNSAFFGVPRHVSRISQAVSLLGLETISALVLSIKVFEAFQPADLKLFSIKALWDHSMTVSEWARQIARCEEVGQEVVDNAMIAGMLHDVGKLVIAVKLPDDYQKAIQLAARENSPVYAAEKQIIGATHAEAGAYLLGIWGFPHSIIEALTFHHHPGQAPVKDFSVLTVVHAANALVHETGGNPQDINNNLIDSEYLAQLGLADRLDLWRDHCPDGLKVSREH